MLRSARRLRTVLRHLPGAFAFGLGCMAFAVHAAEAPACPTPANYSPDHDMLPRVHEGLKQHHLDVLAIGSGAMLSIKPDSGPTLWAQVDADLRRSDPALDVNITVRTARGLAASDMLEQIRRETASAHYQLIVWQTGTIEAVRNVPPGDFYQTLADGADEMARIGADVLLVDPQYSKLLEANSDLDRYEEVMQQAAAFPNVALFHRLDLTQGWAEAGQIDLEHASPDTQDSVFKRLKACLADQISLVILQMSRSF